MSNVSIRYGDKQISFNIPTKNLSAILHPNENHPVEDTAAEIERALNNPIGCETLEKIVKSGDKVLILADDNTRLTPTKDIIPPILNRLNSAGVKDSDIVILIALGTHRPMTEDEIIQKFGTETHRRVKILNHEFKNPNQLHDMGVTENGTPIQINKLLLEFDIIIGVGSIVPHHIPGFSGGAKIVQPGICGEETTAQTHLLSVRSSRSLLGQAENEVRRELELIARKANTHHIFNVVLSEDGRLLKGFFGDIEMAFREGVKLSREIYGVPAAERTDIVVASSYPCDLEFWQAHKSLYACEAVTKEGGTMIIVTPCPEGVAVTHGDMVSFANQSPEAIDTQIKAGIIKDKVAGALALAWAKIRQFATVSIVSDGIDEATAKKLGFIHYKSVEDALEAALKRHGDDAKVTVLPVAGDILPIVEGENI